MATTQFLGPFLLACLAPLLLVVLRIVVRVVVSRTAISVSSPNPLAMVLLSFSTAFLGVDLVQLCLLGDTIAYANRLIFASPGHLLLFLIPDSGEAVVCMLILHFIILIGMLGYAIGNVIAIEISNKTYLIQRISWTQFTSRTGPSKVPRRIKASTQTTERRFVDICGIAVVILTILCYFAPAKR